MNAVEAAATPGGDGASSSHDIAGGSGGTNNAGDERWSSRKVWL